MKDDKLLQFLDAAIRLAIKALAIAMVLVIFWSVADAFFAIYKSMGLPNSFSLEIKDIVGVLGAFLGVLIAIEIYQNIILYLREDVVHVEMVIATALMAVGRKVILLDDKSSDPKSMISMALLALALGITYWLVRRKS